MDTIIKRCVMIQNMIVSELRAIYSEVPNTTSRITVGEEVEYCFAT